MKGYNTVLVIFFLLFFNIGKSQVISYSPSYPHIDDTITITYDASLGNAALLNVPQIYFHSGLITSHSISSNDWKYQPLKWDEPVDSLIPMTALGGNLHQIAFPIKSFFGIGNNVAVQEIAMVFRNGAGDQVGLSSIEDDLFIPIFKKDSFVSRFISPIGRPHWQEIGTSFDVEIQSSELAFINLRLDGNLISQQANSNSLSYNVSASSYGTHELSMTSEYAGSTLTDTLFYIVREPVTLEDPPAGTEEGMNYLDDETVRIMLYAPYKDFVFLIGDFNDWKVTNPYQMKKSLDGNYYWIEVGGLTPQKEYGYQFFIDGKIKVADPWTEKILDPGGDPFIANSTYPDLMDYPEGKTTEILSVLQTGMPDFQWQTQNFERPDNRDLVIYELLIRDFVLRHDYNTVMDSLDYLDSLGVNAIQFMPFMEFEGNNSWGYSPTHFLAADKYYGPAENLKMLIDECHKRGIAVIMDIVFNHCFGQSPFAQMWFDKEKELPANDNPYLNPIATHPYSVGYDFNHDSPKVENLIDRTLNYWVDEYKIDGFRLDLSKGFTQTWSGGDVGVWSSYDQSRIDNIKRLSSVFWNRNGNRWIILEHFANNDEEKELANFGCLLWGKATHEFEQGSMGWITGSDFQWAIDYQSRQWAFHNLVGFMESHDEERIMYTTVEFGNSAGNYDTKELETALERAALNAAMFYSVPGPKMIWQFGELGYDISIMFGGRTAPKPVRWDYFQNPERRQLYNVNKAMIDLKTNYPLFRSGSYDIHSWGISKHIHVNDDNNYGMNATICGNYDVVPMDTWTGFQHVGTWYDYFTGDAMEVTDVDMTIPLGPGDFRVFTDVPLPLPDMSGPAQTSITENFDKDDFLGKIYPNPFQEMAYIQWESNSPGKVKVEIYNTLGQLVKTLEKDQKAKGYDFIQWDGKQRDGTPSSKGQYIFKVSGTSFQMILKGQLN